MPELLLKELCHQHCSGYSKSFWFCSLSFSLRSALYRTSRRRCDTFHLVPLERDRLSSGYICWQWLRVMKCKNTRNMTWYFVHFLGFIFCAIQIKFQSNSKYLKSKGKIAWTIYLMWQSSPPNLSLFSRFWDASLDSSHSLLLVRRTNVVRPVI